jgi:AcrR family transcriptional regulator
MSNTISRKKDTLLDRRDQIFKVAIKSFLKKGVAQTTVREIARAVGMSTGGLYHYFRSKNEIINTGAEWGPRSVIEIKRFRKSLGNVSPTAALKGCIEYWLRRGDLNQDIILFQNRETLMFELDKRHALMQAVRDFIHFFESLVIEGIKTGEFRTDSPTLVAFNIWAAQNEWALRRWLLRDLFTIDEYIEKQTDAILKQVGVDRSQPAENKEVTVHKVTVD